MKFEYVTITMFPTRNDHANQKSHAGNIAIFGSASASVVEAISLLQDCMKGGRTETFGSHQGGRHQSRALTLLLIGAD